MATRRKVQVKNEVVKKKVVKKVVKVEEAVCKVIQVQLSHNKKMRIEIGGWDGGESIDLKVVNFQAPCGDTFSCSREEAKLIAEALIEHI